MSPKKPTKQTPLAAAGTWTIRNQRAFKPIHEKRDIVEGVQLARYVIQRALLKEGVDYDPFDLAEKLAGEMHRGPDGAVDWETFGTWLYAAMVLGIAIGQLVDPSVFTKDGGR